MASIFKPIVNPVLAIGKGFIQVGELVPLLIEIVINVALLIPTIFTPDKLIDDVIYGVMSGINGLFSGMIDSLTIGASASSGGADDQTSGAFGTTKKSQAVCVAPTYFNLMILVLCPPLMLFIKKKWKGIILVIICALLTYYCYYFPGLIFASLHVLC